MKKLAYALGLMMILPHAFAVEVGHPTQLIAKVTGVVCSFCAYGTEKNLARVGFLNKSLYGDGVLVDIKTGLITLALNPGVPIDFQKVKGAIDYGGYTFVSIHLNLVGTVNKDGKHTVLKSSANSQKFHLVDAKGKPWKPGDLLGKQVSIQGTVPKSYLGRKGKKSRATVRVESASAVRAEPSGEGSETAAN